MYICVGLVCLLLFLIASVNFPKISNNFLAAVFQGIPAAPTTLKAITSNTNSTLTEISWRDNSLNETHFEIWRTPSAQAAECTSGNNRVHIASVLGKVLPGQSMRFIDNGASMMGYPFQPLVIGRPYYYCVRAVNSNPSGGSSPWTVVIRTVNGTPALPTKLIAIAGLNPQTIDVLWQDNSYNENGFIIERSLDGRVWNVIGESDVSDYTDGGKVNNSVLPGQKYFYRVRAYNRNLNLYSAYSNVTNFTLMPAQFTQSSSVSTDLNSRDPINDIKYDPNSLKVIWQVKQTFPAQYDSFVVERMVQDTSSALKSTTAADWRLVARIPAGNQISSGQSQLKGFMLLDQLGYAGNYEYRIRGVKLGQTLTTYTAPITVEVSNFHAEAVLNALKANSEKIFGKSKDTTVTHQTITQKFMCLLTVQEAHAAFPTDNNFNCSPEELAEQALNLISKLAFGFSAIDKNGDGIITQQEIRNHNANTEVRNVLNITYVPDLLRPFFNKKEFVDMAKDPDDYYKTFGSEFYKCLNDYLKELRKRQEVLEALTGKNQYTRDDFENLIDDMSLAYQQYGLFMMNYDSEFIGPYQTDGQGLLTQALTDSIDWADKLPQDVKDLLCNWRDMYDDFLDCIQLDMCINIPGQQYFVPDGYIYVNGRCFPIEKYTPTPTPSAYISSSPSPSP
jgi:hypothetical protein